MRQRISVVPVAASVLRIAGVGKSEKDAGHRLSLIEIGFRDFENLVTDSNVKLAKNGCNSGEVRPDGHQKRGTSDLLTNDGSPTEASI